MLLFPSLNYPESDSLLSESGSTDSKTKLPSKSWKKRSTQRPVTDGGCTEGGLDTHDHFAATDGSFRCPIQPRLGLSKCGTQTISITWNLVRKVNSQPHLGPSESAAGEWGEEGTASKACR